MGQCCVRWGTVDAVLGPQLLVETSPLVLEQGKLALGPPRLESVSRWVDGRGFVDAVAPGDHVAIHWGWACDHLTPAQCASLEHYTCRHIDLCNTTL
jgi:hypothetical protein